MERAVADLRLRLGISDGYGDAEAIAVCCGLTLCPREGCKTGALEADVIYYQQGAPPEERQRQVARELGRWILLRYGFDGPSNYLSYFAGQMAIAGPIVSRRSKMPGRAVM